APSSPPIRPPSGTHSGATRTMSRCASLPGPTVYLTRQSPLSATNCGPSTGPLGLADACRVAFVDSSGPSPAHVLSTDQPAVASRTRTSLTCQGSAADAGSTGTVNRTRPAEYRPASSNWKIFSLRSGSGTG